MVYEWKKIDVLDLVRYVFPEARKHLPLPPDVNVLDQRLDGEGRLRVLRTLYDALRGANIKYALEPFSPVRIAQLIRSPEDVLQGQREGTCLDLALMFCGLCIGYELLPILVVLEGHVFVLVSLRHGLRDWDAFNRGEFESHFRQIKLAEAEPLRNLVESGAYVAVECTGFTSSRSLPRDTPEGEGRQEDGTLSFDRALTAGREHLRRPDKRPLEYALDIAVAHYLYGLTPREVHVPRPWADRDFRHSPRSTDQLAYLLDRSEQELELGKALLYHQERKPRRPFVCVFHGDEHESHSKFLERLHLTSFPKLLTTIRPGMCEVVTPYPMQVKFGGHAASGKDGYWDNVRASRFNNKPIPIDGMKEIITGRGTHLMFNLSMFAKEFGSTKPEVLDAFFKFWEEWPDSPEDYLLIVCIGIKYRRAFGLARARLLSRLWPSGPNGRLRSYLEGLDFDSFPRLHGVCLPELGAIDESEALLLINDPLIQELFEFTEAEVRAIYRTARGGRLPMETLLDALEKLHKDRTGLAGRR